MSEPPSIVEKDSSWTSAMTKYGELATKVRTSPVIIQWIFRFGDGTEVTFETELHKVGDTNLNADCLEIDRRFRYGVGL